MTAVDQNVIAKLKPLALRAPSTQNTLVGPSLAREWLETLSAHTVFIVLLAMSFATTGVVTLAVGIAIAFRRQRRHDDQSGGERRRA